MCLKIGEHLDKKISYKILMVRVVLNTLIFRVLNLLPREAVFMKNEVDPLRVNRLLPSPLERSLSNDLST